jgi:hypothetical protein
MRSRQIIRIRRRIFVRDLHGNHFAVDVTLDLPIEGLMGLIHGKLDLKSGEQLLNAWPPTELLVCFFGFHDREILVQ